MGFCDFYENGRDFPEIWEVYGAFEGIRVRKLGKAGAAGDRLGGRWGDQRRSLA